MNEIDTNKLLRERNALQDELDLCKTALKESRAALVAANLTVQALVEQCMALVSDLGGDVKPAIDVGELKNTLADLQDTSWLTELRLDAFERGFIEGYTYALKKERTITNTAEALQHYKERTEAAWPSAKPISLLAWRKRASAPSLERYSYDPLREDDPFTYDDAGPFMAFSVYADLKLQFDVLKEELAGYKWLLHDPDATPLSKDFAKEACQNHVRTPQKPGILKAQYGKNRGERDMFVLYGKGVPSCDRALMMNVFGAKQMRFDYEKRMPAFERSLVEEFAVRGYDLSTLRFSICKKIDV